MSKYDQPSSYNSIIPWPVYLGLQNEWTQGIFENDRDWVKRLAFSLLTSTPNQNLVSDMMPLSGKTFKDELLQKVAIRTLNADGSGAMKRDELMDGLSRVTEKQVYTGGAKGVAPKQVNLPYNDNALAIQGGIDPAERCKKIIDKLVSATSVDTPANGSVFWNGIDQRALVLHIEKWNKEIPGTFGQLEATTDVRHVDGKFVWNDAEPGKNLQAYFAGVSENYGDKAKGIMSAAVLWGFRDTSILTYSELPKILYNMAGQLEKGETPAVTGVSIVIIDALNSNGDVNIVNNSDILELPIWSPKVGTKGYAKNDCVMSGIKLKDFINTTGSWTGRPTVPASAALLKYLKDQPNVSSPAALKIKADARNLVRSTNAF